MSGLSTTQDLLKSSQDLFKQAEHARQKAIEECYQLKLTIEKVFLAVGMDIHSQTRPHCLQKFSETVGSALKSEKPSKITSEECQELINTTVRLVDGTLKDLTAMQNAKDEIPKSLTSKKRKRQLSVSSSSTSSSEHNLLANANKHSSTRVDSSSVCSRAVQTRHRVCIVHPSTVTCSKALSSCTSWDSLPWADALFVRRGMRMGCWRTKVSKHTVDFLGYNSVP